MGNGGFKVLINGCLSKANKEVFNAALSFEKKFHYIRTNHCFTYLKNDEGHQATIVRRIEDLCGDFILI